MDAREKKTKPKSREYPAVTLVDAIAFIEKLKDYPINKPISYEIAAGTCGVKTTTNSFKYTLSSAKQYGLIATSAGKTITFLEPAKELARPTKDEDAIRRLKVECFRTPKLYAELIEAYEGRTIPSAQTLENALVNNYFILPAVAKGAAETFIKNANDVGAVQSGVLTLSAPDLDFAPNDVNDSSTSSALPSSQAQTTLDDLSMDSPEFAAPLNIPFGDKRRAVLLMPIDATKDDAEYVRDMITLMFKRVYKVESNV